MTLRHRNRVRKNGGEQVVRELEAAEASDPADSAADKARLAEMHRRGTQFIVGDCLTKAIVAEIVGSE